MKYYFLVTLLPDIRRDDRKIALRFADLIDEKRFIAPDDWREVERLLLARDILLLEKLLSGKDPDVEPTLHDKAFWQEQIRAPREGPEFLQEFLRRHAEERSFGPEAVDRLWEGYYDHVVRSTDSPLLRDYFQFEKLLRNVLAAVRARRRGLAPSDHVLGEDEVAERLGRSGAEDFGLGREFPWIERLAETKDPLELVDAVEGILWDHLDERIRRYTFEFEVVLAHLLKLRLLEKRLALSEERGMEIVSNLEAV
ncbi:MAG: DUF2764 family protein [Candidatus Krumholzibacteriota bacterium]|nr:DUF2764 family protein [Candidatus Krumholzibacteriota bacterium]